MFPPAVAASAREDDSAGYGRADRSAVRSGEIDPRMEAVAAWPEDVADARAASGGARLTGSGERAGAEQRSSFAPRSRPLSIPAQRWKPRSALSVCEPRSPSKFPDGKPCQASANWSAATSHPRAPKASSPAERGAPAVAAERLARSRARNAVGC